MALTKGKHVVDEINGVRCTIVETGINKQRADFLKDLLEWNKFEVIVAEEKKADENTASTYKLGVTDLVFNPLTAVYERSLRTKAGNKVTPAYWNMQMDSCNPSYWEFDRKTPEDPNVYITYRSV